MPLTLVWRLTTSYLIIINKQCTNPLKSMFAVVVVLVYYVTTKQKHIIQWNYYNNCFQFNNGNLFSAKRFYYINFDIKYVEEICKCLNFNAEKQWAIFNISWTFKYGIMHMPSTFKLSNDFKICWLMRYVFETKSYWMWQV